MEARSLQQGQREWQPQFLVFSKRPKHLQIGVEEDVRTVQPHFCSDWRNNTEGDVDPNVFEEFLEPEEYVDRGHLLITDRIFNSKVELVNWAKETAMKANTYLNITRYLKSRTSDCRPFLTLACERGVEDEEEEVLIKRWGPYGTNICGCLFKLKGEQMVTCENWILFVHDGKHNHKIVVYNHGHAQAARLMEEQLKQTEEYRKSHVPLRNIYDFSENKMLVVR
ncbi:hypothetical protein M9H77_31986 [Catharanthus roseus]|uniref:Uncharacterized protein n=1 Tax=Catharanthus roseus TaxID=4058 RepID=A0ACC0A2I7_CATRO|nr:hypothetical protein M9H77_31986 [Catharanthus roseus]